MFKFFYIICLLCCFNAFSQISIDQKKGKYTVLSENGKKLIKKVDSVIVFPQDHYSSFFATITDGYHSVWRMENSEELVSVLEGDYSSIRVSPYGKKEMRIYDFYGNHRIISSEGIVSEMVPRENIGSGMNNKGKVALCSSESNLTPYEYNYIYRMEGLPLSWFIARTQEGKIVMNESGKIISGQVMDDYYSSAYHDSVLIARKGNLWSIIDLTGYFKLPPTDLVYPYWLFNFDGPSYANLDHQTAIYRKDGKKGVIDLNGNSFIPAKYDDLRRARTYYRDENGEFVSGRSRFALRPDSTVNDWLIIDTNYQEMFSIKEDVFISTKVKNALFMTDNQLKIYDFSTGQKTIFDPEEYDEEFIFNGNEKYGVADRSGKLIIPYQFDYIKKFEGDDGLRYFICTKNKKAALYNKLGVCVSEGLEFERLSQVCNGNTKFVRVVNGKLTGIGTMIDGELKVIVPIEFRMISCHSLDVSKPFAKGFKGEQTYWIYQDGRIEAID